jgi:hypothetical protein
VYSQKNSAFIAKRKEKIKTEFSFTFTFLQTTHKIAMARDSCLARVTAGAAVGGAVGGAVGQLSTYTIFLFIYTLNFIHVLFLV